MKLLSTQQEEATLPGEAWIQKRVKWEVPSRTHSPPLREGCLVQLRRLVPAYVKRYGLPTATLKFGPDGCLPSLSFQVFFLLLLFVGRKPLYYLNRKSSPKTSIFV